MADVNSKDHTSICVEVTGAWKRYSRRGNDVLKDLHMKVPASSIYGLLGESGCGKTTLLTCIIGLQQLDYGSINIWRKRVGSHNCGIPGPTVGYMPQDISIYPSLTAGETLFLFGSFHGISPERIREKSKMYTELLEIPDNRLAANMSGGQQRRLSLAIALFHDPKLLILDEPTVGVDPILRETIWEYLLLLSTEGRTIIISTHYIDEVKKARMVGFLRQGSIIAEKSPSAFLEQYNTDSLEKVFLVEARSHDKKIEESDKAGLKHVAKKIKNPIINCKFELNQYFSWNISKTIVWKESTRLQRHIGVFLGIMILPIIAFTISALIFRNNYPRTTYGIVNDENADDPTCMNTPLSVLENCNLTRLSCHFLHYMLSTAPIITLEAMESVEEANEAIIAGRIGVALKFSQDYSKNFRNRIEEGVHTSNEAIHNSNVVVLRDGSDFYVEYPMFDLFLKTSTMFAATVLSACGLNPAVTKLPIEYEPVYGSIEQTMKARIGVGVNVVFTVSVLMLYTGLSFMEEKQFRTFDRMWVSGVSMFHFVTGFMIVQYALTVLQWIILLFAMYVSGISFAISPIWAILLMLTTTPLTSAMGGYISYYQDDEVKASYILFAFFFVYMCYAGVLWATEFLHPIVQVIVRVLPITRVITSIRAMINTGWTIDHPHVWPGYVSSPLWTIAIVIFATVVVKLKKCFCG